MIYTSYWGNVKTLEKCEIKPIAISRGKPRGWQGASYDALAPTWTMLQMNDEDYSAAYDAILAANDPDDFVRWLGEDDVALLCWEKDPTDCHRSTIAKWLRNAGYEVEEFDHKKYEKDRDPQMRLF